MNGQPTQVLMVRHAVAEDADAVGSDFARPLTNKGRKQFRQLAKWLCERDAAPSLIISSPLVRAVQTAEILGDVAGLGAKHCRVDEHLRPGVDSAKLAQFVEELGVERIALVGHEPDMSRCVSEFIGGGHVSFPKGGIACMEFLNRVELGAGELLWFVHPKLV